MKYNNNTENNNSILKDISILNENLYKAGDNNIEKTQKSPFL